MSGYRFCRTDDIPLLVEAYNRCYAPWVEGAAPLTVEDFKRDVRELDVWASSCMIAFKGDEPVGVLLATKRDHETLIHRIGVHPAHRRQGHGQHLLDSLSRKLAILGPPRLVTELPEEAREARRFFEACGYRPEAGFADYVFESPARSGRAGALAVPISLPEVVESGAWNRQPRRSWIRSLETLTNLQAELEGLAVATDERVEAWILARNRRARVREIVSLGAAPGERARAVLGILVRHRAGHERSVVIPRISPEELDPSILESWGFRKGTAYVAYAAEVGATAP